MEPRELIHEGFMRKSPPEEKIERNFKWHTRFFKLWSDQTLEYYKNKTDSKPLREPIDLKSCSGIYETDPKYAKYLRKKYKKPFCLSTKHRKYNFAVELEEERDIWKQCLRKVCKFGPDMKALDQENIQLVHDTNKDTDSHENWSSSIESSIESPSIRSMSDLSSNQAISVRDEDEFSSGGSPGSGSSFNEASYDELPLPVPVEHAFRRSATYDPHFNTNVLSLGASVENTVRRSSSECSPHFNIKVLSTSINSQKQHVTRAPSEIYSAYVDMSKDIITEPKHESKGSEYIEYTKMQDNINESPTFNKTFVQLGGSVRRGAQTLKLGSYSPKLDISPKVLTLGNVRNNHVIALTNGRHVSNTQLFAPSSHIPALEEGMSPPLIHRDIKPHQKPLVDRDTKPILKKQNSYVNQKTMPWSDPFDLDKSFDSSHLTSFRRRNDDYNQHHLFYTNNNSNRIQQEDSISEDSFSSETNDIDNSYEVNNIPSADNYYNIDPFNERDLSMRVDYGNAELPALPTDDTNDYVNDEYNTKPYQTVTPLSSMSPSHMKDLHYSECHAQYANVCDGRLRKFVIGESKTGTHYIMVDPEKSQALKELR